MRIAYLTHQYFPRHIGGTEVYTQDLARYALEQGHEALIYTYVESPSGDPADYGLVETEHEGIPLYEVHYNLSVAHNPARYEYNNPYIENLLREHLEQQAPDIVHATHLMKLSASAIAAAQSIPAPMFVTLTDFWAICGRHTLIRWNGKLCSGPAHRLDCVRCLQDLHGFASLDLFVSSNPLSALAQVPEKTRRYFQELWAISNRNAWLRETIRGVAQIISLSPSLKDMLVTNGFSEERLKVIPHGISSQKASRTRSIGQQPKRALFIGNIEPHKGLHILIEAFSQIPDADLQLEIYGELKEGDPYGAKLLEQSQADPRIHWRGTFPPSQLMQTVIDADALLVPAQWYENAPYVVQAALRLGVPIIASRITSLIDMLEGHPGHVLVEPDDPRQWAQRLHNLALGEPAYPVEKVDWPTMQDHAREVFSLYHQTLESDNGI